MATSRHKKQQIIDRIESDVKVQKSVVLITTLGSETSLDAEQNSTLRKNARQSGVKISIIKNTILKKLFTNLPELSGQTYIAYQADANDADEVKTAKTIVDLLKKDYKEYFSIVGTVLEGEFVDPAMTKTLASTPAFEESISKVAGSLQQITAKIAMGVKEIPGSLVRVIDQVKDQK